MTVGCKTSRHGGGMVVVCQPHA